jgi:hypothetical protein
MTLQKQFRRVLPVGQTVIAIVFGAWGEWQRVQIVNRSLGWASTVAFHIWPWPLKFALILNMPAFLIGSFLDWRLNSLWPNRPEYLQLLPVILVVPFLWYGTGRWLARRSVAADRGTNSSKLIWAIILFFILFCAVGAPLASPSTMLLFGLGAWTAVAVWMAVSTIYEKLRSKRAQHA